MAAKKKKPQDRKKQLPSSRLGLAKVAAPGRRVTAAGEWSRAPRFELPLPSGNVCLVRRPGLTELLASGVFPDEILGIIQESMDAAVARLEGREPKRTDADALNDAISDPARLRRMMDAFDIATAYAVIEPRVLYHRTKDGEFIHPADRDPEALYTDDVDDDDKIFIFNFVSGGTSDLSRFREEQSAFMADLQNGREVQAASQHDSES